MTQYLQNFLAIVIIIDTAINKIVFRFCGCDISLFSKMPTIRSPKLLSNEVFLHAFIDLVVCSCATSPSATWIGAKARASLGP